MEWLLLIDLGTLIWYSYFASMGIVWFSFGMDDGKDGKESFKELEPGAQIWGFVIITVVAPAILIAIILMWFYNKGRQWGGMKKERAKLKREKKFGNEEGMDDSALDRLGINDEWST